MNYFNGKTTNERFAKKALNSFSEDGTNLGGETEMDTESLLHATFSRGSIVEDDS
jgi:hypothetical protein